MRRGLEVKRGFMMLAILGMVLFSCQAMADDGKKADHPELSEQEMLIGCADCHREATPEVEKEWYDSVHGIAMVKCYQCHGSYGEFEVTPSKANCATCHTDMVEKHVEVPGKDVQDKPCWECHVPHTFKAKE